MEKRTLGKTDTAISRLGAGLAEIGFELSLQDTDEAAGVLNSALDGGINFLDTAACYDVSEELIGQAIMAQPGEANSLLYFVNTTFNYPTMAEAYRVAALNGLNRV